MAPGLRRGLIAHSAILPGDRVLDAGVGTGFAAIAAAMRVGPRGRVVGVDVSPGMLQQARVAVEALADADFACAWESNLRSAAHAAVRSLAPADLEALHLRCERALDSRRRVDPSFAVAEVLYAYGAKAADGHD